MKRLAIVLAWLLFVGGLTFAVIRFSGLLDSMLVAGEPADISLGPDIELPKSPTYFLICPLEACPSTHRNAQSPAFDAAPDTVATALQATAGELGMKLVEGDGLSLELRFLARTPIFRFPDWVDVKVIPSEQGGSRVFAYSRSVYGNDDFGQNEKRLKSWMAATVALIGQQATPQN
ncbi:DUF1499 domain-containing protein [Thalassospira xiamenensis]|uniref:DUF1499 domain-containing protein n=1 Tax=Thalassospira xiamenensis TaxID=220697 RepID=A0A367X3E9_9PROT|nr:DUF1499 domain-containing protein [Thalassospira xiamenensis]KZB56078.1 hypothetical protein AUP41_15080 [Thalassospira xiamenensis]MBL4839723.1 DUF1499 domain-containing protein [Thalassospira sp.]RCK47590.1 hypothetical protein TH44_18210 [Thalassospira xiamenensis]UKV15909.1 DUF1499 domain-containing protein [Thalassospiraceae bacterium SW-3-3]